MYKPRDFYLLFMSIRRAWVVTHEGVYYQNFGPRIRPMGTASIEGTKLIQPKQLVRVYGLKLTKGSRSVFNALPIWDGTSMARTMNRSFVLYVERSHVEATKLLCSWTSHAT